MSILYLTIAFSLNAVANILLKLGASNGFVFPGETALNFLRGNIYFFSGAILFAINIFFYFLALRNLPLSVAYPIMVGMGFLLVNGYALYMLSERITLLQVFGYLLLLAGIVLISFFGGESV